MRAKSSTIFCFIRNLQASKSYFKIKRLNYLQPNNFEHWSEHIENIFIIQRMLSNLFTRGGFHWSIINLSRNVSYPVYFRFIFLLSCFLFALNYFDSIRLLWTTNWLKYQRSWNLQFKIVPFLLFSRRFSEVNLTKLCSCIIKYENYEDSKSF